MICVDVITVSTSFSRPVEGVAATYPVRRGARNRIYGAAGPRLSGWRCGGYGKTRG